MKPFDSSAASTVDGAPLAETRAELPRGTTVGRYVLLEPLGQGGMGVVYKAYDPELDRAVALKFLRTEGGSTELRDRLLREAQALARLSHPNVIAVHDVGTFDADVFIAMEYVEGPTLQAWLASSARSHRAIVDAFVAAGEGLAAAHRAGLVHRDFKPDNVIVGNDGRVRVLDFGVARAAESGEPGEPAEAAASPPSRNGSPSVASAPDGLSGPSSSGSPVGLPRSLFSGAELSGSVSRSGALLGASLTQAGVVVGTPMFMAPEQHLGAVVDERADQFSFCVSMYSAVYGVFPFAGKRLTEYRANVMRGRVQDPPPRTTVPRWLRKVLLRGLARIPADRYPSMAALLTAVRADPREARRRWLPAVALLGVVGLGAGAYREARRSQASACEGAPHKLEGVWDAGRRAAVRDAFLASGKAYAVATVATVERVFDRYALEWAAMHRDACEATHIRHEESQELLDLRMACLDDRLARLRALGDVYAHADADVVERAGQSAQSLPTLEACADATGLRAPVPPPSDALTRKQVEDVRKDLVRAGALSLAGKYHDGLQVATATAAAAAELHYAPLEAEAKYTLSELLNHTADFTLAGKTTHEAFVAALAGHHDEYVARAAIRMISEARHRSDQFDEGHRWVAVANAAIERLQQKDSLRAAYHFNLASLLDDEGKYEESLTEYGRSLALQEAMWGPDQGAVTASLNNAGIVFLALGRFDECLAYHRRALAIREAIYGSDHPLVAVSLDNIASALTDQGHPGEGLASASRALSIHEKVLGPDHPSLAHSLNTMGLALSQLGHYEEALIHSRRALAIREKALGPDDPYVALVHDHLAAILREQGNYEASLAEAQRSLAIREKRFGNEHPFLAYSLQDIAAALIGLGRYQEASTAAGRALAVREAKLGPNHYELAQPLLSLAEASMGRHNAMEAVAPLERALALAVKAKVDPKVVADVSFALARALVGVGRDQDRALALARQARETYAAAGPVGAKALDRIDAWLRERR